jgi:hypothetical protein
VRLRGGPEGSASLVYVRESGELVVECFDHGEAAEAAFGNDVALLVAVSPEWKPRVFERLGGEGACSDAALLALVAERFESYFDAKAWLEAEDIPFRREFDPRA